MCGIAGFTGKGSSDDGKRMISSIAYRGPDYQGVFHRDNICLTHARLSIIDLSSGANQPMFNRDKTLGIVFNGEIYNYLDLKKELLALNKYSFETSGDTEVLLYLYEEYGEKMPAKLNGMFALAIYDFRKEELFLARDRMGKKPLYYSASPNSFVFASELKAITKHPDVSKEADLSSVSLYLTFDYVPSPDSVIKNIHKLDPSHYALVKNNRIVKKERYWHYDFTVNKSITFTEATEKLDTLLNDATRSRLMSDVPLGVFLSGGLDSSAIAYYAQKNSSQKIKTFSIGFEDKSYDEASYASQVANHLGTDHHLEILTPKTTLSLIDEIFPKLDEPFADASIIPTYYLSKFTRRHVTVALGGDGSDELLAGYPTFTSDHFKFPLANLPAAVSGLLYKLVNTTLPSSDKNISFDFKVKQFLRGFRHKREHIHQLWLGSFLPEEKQKLFTKDALSHITKNADLGYISRRMSESPGLNEYDNITYYYCVTYLLDDILVKVDRASMYNSLEVRSPFLDKNVVEFLFSLPDNFIRKNLGGKHILKKAMENKLPDNIIYRPKKGFGIPLSDWIRKDLRATMEQQLLSEDTGLFNKSYIAGLFNQHCSGKANHRKLLWNLFVFNYWHRNFLKN